MKTDVHWLEHWLDSTTACNVTRENTSSLETTDTSFIAFAEGQRALRGPMQACDVCLRNARVAQASRLHAKRRGEVPRVLPPSGFQRHPDRDSVVAGSFTSPGRPQAAGLEGTEP